MYDWCMISFMPCCDVCHLTIKGWDGPSSGSSFNNLGSSFGVSGFHLWFPKHMEPKWLLVVHLPFVISVYLASTLWCFFLQCPCHFIHCWQVVVPGLYKKCFCLMPNIFRVVCSHISLILLVSAFGVTSVTLKLTGLVLIQFMWKDLVLWFIPQKSWSSEGKPFHKYFDMTFLL